MYRYIAWQDCVVSKSVVIWLVMVKWWVNESTANEFSFDMKASWIDLVMYVLMLKKNITTTSTYDHGVLIFNFKPSALLSKWLLFTSSVRFQQIDDTITFTLSYMMPHSLNVGLMVLLQNTSCLNTPWNMLCLLFAIPMFIKSSTNANKRP